VSINLEDVPYPHPVSYLEQELFGQVVRLAHMDVAPVGAANGRTVVLLHGGSYYGWYWKDTIEALRNEGYRVVVVDRLGWGRSSKPILPYSINLHAANTRAILDHLGIGEVAVVGHSIGGQEASRYAFLYPETTTHFVMVNPVGLTDSREGREWRAPDWDGGTPDMQQVYESILRREYTRVGEWKPEFLEHVRISYGQYLSGEWPRLSYVRSLAGSARSIDTVVNDWPRMETKGAIISGADDGPSFPAQARAAVDALQNAELVLFPGVGHNPHLEVPERFNAELIRFLATDPAERAGEGGR
jgi:pimeloyl-ACP methyl ester carboxylesterase